MTIYIPEFWCGVIATVLAEFAGLVLLVAWARKKIKDEEKWK